LEVDVLPLFLKTRNGRTYVQLFNKGKAKFERKKKVQDFLLKKSASEQFFKETGQLINQNDLNSPTSNPELDFSFSGYRRDASFSSVTSTSSFSLSGMSDFSSSSESTVPTNFRQSASLMSFPQYSDSISSESPRSHVPSKSIF